MTREEVRARIRAKAILGLPLTEKERSMFLLYIATLEKAKWFLRNESK